MGELDIAALEKTFSEIVRRHEILRTSFQHNLGSTAGGRQSTGRPVQQIAPALPLKIPVTNLSALGDEDKETESMRIIADQFQQPFGYSSKSLMRIFLLRLSP